MKKNIIFSILGFTMMHSLQTLSLENQLQYLQEGLATLKSLLIKPQAEKKPRKHKGWMETVAVELLGLEEQEAMIPQTNVGNAWKKPTKQNFNYKNENEVRDKRKIIVFAYGSLINQKKSPSDENKLKAGQFVKTNIKVPVSLTRISSDNKPYRRATVVIDNQSDEERNLWAAFSKFSYLPNARNNLAAREGTAYENQQKGYNLRNIFYIKKLLPNQNPDLNERPLEGVSGWVVRTGVDELQLPDSILKKMAQLANQNGANTAIWAAFPSNASREDILNKFKTDMIFRTNTLDYIDLLPEPKTQTEENIIELHRHLIRE